MAEWQTRRPQKLVPARGWRFDSSPGHCIEQKDWRPVAQEVVTGLQELNQHLQNAVLGTGEEGTSSKFGYYIKENRSHR